MARILKQNAFMFGGDYSPEQWPEETWPHDIELMKELGVNTVTINVHSWIFDEKEEGKYDFSWLDKVVSMLKEANIDIVMATATTAPPAWLYEKDHEVLKTDIKGRAMKHGVREHFCPTSPTYINAVRNLVDKLSEHYKDEKSIKLWHLNNELSGFCYCEHCQKEFRLWLEQKYKTIDNLNASWCTAMWGRYYTSFNDIYAPTELNELYINVDKEGFDLDSLPTEAIEYARFMSDSHKKLFEIEVKCIKKNIPDAVCTNNFQFRDRFNYHEIAKAFDTIALDIYPNRGEPSYLAAFNLDIARNFKTQDTPFTIMEMTPNHASWAKVCNTKRPGEVARIAMNNIAHGANSALFFQIRQTPAGFEKVHGAMVSHCGHLDTRIAKELIELSNALRKLPRELMEATLSPKVAVIHDWDEKLGVEIPCTVQKDINYSAEVQHYYRYFVEKNINVDVISLDQDYSRYKLLVAPMVTMIKEEDAKRMEEYVKDGGTLVLTYHSGYTNECDYMYLGGQPGPLRRVAGLWVEETDGVKENNEMIFEDGFSCNTGFMCDVVRTESAEPIAYYGKDYYKDNPCLLRNYFGKGECIYIASKPEYKGIEHIFDSLTHKLEIHSVLETPQGVDAIKRGKWLFLINNNEYSVSVELKASMRNILTNDIEKKVKLIPNGYAIYE